MDDSSHPISDLVIPPDTTLGETSEHASPETEPQMEFYSKVITASNDMVRCIHMHTKHSIIQIYLLKGKYIALLQVVLTTIQSTQNKLSI